MNLPANETRQSTILRSRWLWVPFVITFVVIALATKQSIPFRDGIAYTPTWNYYLSAFPKLFSAQPLGPVMYSTSHLFSTLSVHFIISFIVGLIAAGIARMALRRRTAP